MLKSRRNKIIAGVFTLGLAVAVVMFVIFALPLITAESEASRDVQAEVICSGNTITDNPDAQCFTIIGDESEVRFTLNEELGGVPTTVVGRTNQVAGEILIDVTNPSDSEIGPIEINLRTLETDRSLRNQQIRAQILKSGQDEYEFTTFTPTTLVGLPDTVTVGEPFDFTVTGDLPLVGVTRSITFNVTVTPESETRIRGLASTVVLRSDYGIEIPNVRGVANVTNEVLLEIEFVAELVTEPTSIDE